MRERDLLEHIYAANRPLDAAAVTLGPGDDMGGLRVPAVDEDGETIGTGEVLITVDQVADGIHFDLATTPLEKIARKAVTRNLSDVAAMAATPLGAVVAVSLPRDFGRDRATHLFDAMRETAAAYDCPLIGGDISIWDGPLLLTVTVLAHGGGVAPVRRSGAQPGDALFVTGTLGGSLVTVNDRTHHLDFEPRLRVARQLAFLPDVDVHAMIDLSDGLAADLPRVCEASGVRAELWVDRLPISRAAHVAEQQDGRPAWQHALHDGEDYELLFAVPLQQAGHLRPGVFNGVPVTQIGRVLAPAQEVSAAPSAQTHVTLRWSDGRTEPMPTGGWDHTGDGDRPSGTPNRL